MTSGDLTPSAANLDETNIPVLPQHQRASAYIRMNADANVKIRFLTLSPWN